MALSLDEIRLLVEERKVDLLIGQFENQFFDAKSQPYFFDNNDVRRELAKDVSGFANGDGGCIVLGLVTKASEVHPGEEVSILEPFPQKLFDPDQYQKILAEWIFPPVKDILVKWIPADNQQDKGYGLIFISPQDHQLKPFLINRSIGDKKTTDLMIGYVERRLDRTDVRTVVEIQHAMRMGLRMEQEILSRIDRIESMMESHFGSTEIAKTLELAESNLDQRRAEIVQLIPGPRKLLLSACPLASTEVSSIFSDQPGSIKQYLSEPPELRPAGWGLKTGDQPKAIKGELIRAKSHRSVVDIYRDGLLLFVGNIYQNFLAWADLNNRRIHPLALCEIVTNFAQFFELILKDLKPTPNKLRFSIEVSGLHVGGVTTYLPAGPVGPAPFPYSPYIQEAPEDHWKKDLIVDAKNYNPAKVAFSLVRELYLWFGHSEESIPYRRTEEATFDIDAIANIK